MATYATPVPDGKTSPAGFLRILGKIFTGSGVIEADALKVSAQDTPDMTVKISGSTLNDNAILIHTDGTFIQAWNDQVENVTIPANSTGVTKTDAIVAYVDLDSGEGLESTPNNQGALKFKVIRRGGTLTGNPTSSEITADADVGSNPYLVLAYVTVANGSSSINSGNLTDARVRATLNSGQLSAFSASTLPGTALGKVVGCKATRTSNFSVTTATETHVPFDAEEFDTDSMHSTSVNTDRITIQTSGIYLVMASVRWPASTSGRRFASIEKNATTPGSGTVLVLDQASPSDGDGRVTNNLTAYANLTAGDHLKLDIFQNSGGSLSVPNAAMFMSAVRIGTTT